MKSIFLKIGGIAASLGLMATAMNVNTTCMLFAYQPKLPKSAKKLPRF